MKAKIPIKFWRNFQSINFVFHRRFSVDFRKEFHVNFNMILHRKFIISCWISYEISHEIYFYTELDIKDTFVRNFTFHRKFRMTYYWKCHMTKSPGASQGMVSDNTATIWRPGPRFNIKTVFFRYGDTHIKDKTVARPSYLYNCDPYTGKTTSLYWDSLLDPALCVSFPWSSE